MEPEPGAPDAGWFCAEGKGWRDGASQGQRTRREIREGGHSCPLQGRGLARDGSGGKVSSCWVPSCRPCQARIIFFPGSGVYLLALHPLGEQVKQVS